jgi:hypothetical protein
MAGQRLFMAYGTVSGVASHAKTWTRGGAFYDASASPLVAPTKPTYTEVETWLEQVSNLFDRALSNEGFEVPVVAVKSASLITLEVERIVADLCDRVNGVGRLAQDRVLHIGYMKVLANEVRAWVQEGATGFENDGVPRTQMSSTITGGFSVTANR